MSAFQYSEARLSERLSVSRDRLKALRSRRLADGADWKKVGAEILFSNRGLKRVWRELRPGVALFDLRDCLMVVSHKKNGAAVCNGAAHAIHLGDASMPIPVAVKVTHVCLNPYVVNTVDEHGLRQLAWVGNNANFSIGMSIQVVPDKKNAAMWRYSGPMPQRKYTPGEWDRRLKAGFKG